MKPETMRIWERGLTDVRVRGTLQHGAALLEMDAYRKELEAKVARVKEECISIVGRFMDTDAPLVRNIIEALREER